MKSIHIIYTFLCIILSSLLSACTEDFEEVNTNPNEPNQVLTSHLLVSAQRAVVNQFYGNHATLAPVGMAPNIYVQYVAGLRGGNDDIYLTVEENFESLYQEALRDLTEIIKLNQNPATAEVMLESGANENQIAVARILKAWTFHNMTDIWGDIPYSQALQGTDVTLPEYNSQEDIYLDLLKELTEAAAQINEEEAGVAGDIIYLGDMTKWKLFANSLKMRVGMRLSEVAPDVASKAVAEAFAAGIFTNNNQNALYSYLSSAPNNNPFYYRYFLSVPNYGVTNTMIDKLKVLNDPRLALYADEAQLNDEGGGYLGMPFGLDRSKASAIRDKAVSWPDAEKVLGITTPFVIMSYSEVLFLQAEAAERGWIGGDAASLFHEAIAASMEYWGVEQSQIEDYLAQPIIAYDTSNPFKSIGEQKWISLYMQGIQGWSEWRRLGFPELQVAPDAVISDIPRRKGYPTSETNLNSANYQIAVSRQGTDDLLTRVWWDVD